MKNIGQVVKLWLIFFLIHAKKTWLGYSPTDLIKQQQREWIWYHPGAIIAMSDACLRLAPTLCAHLYVAEEIHSLLAAQNLATTFHGQTCLLASDPPTTPDDHFPAIQHLFYQHLLHGLRTQYSTTLPPILPTYQNMQPFLTNNPPQKTITFLSTLPTPPNATLLTLFAQLAQAGHTIQRVNMPSPHKKCHIEHY